MSVINAIKNLFNKSENNKDNHLLEPIININKSYKCNISIDNWEVVEIDNKTHSQYIIGESIKSKISIDNWKVVEFDDTIDWTIDDDEYKINY